MNSPYQVWVLSRTAQPIVREFSNRVSAAMFLRTQPNWLHPQNVVLILHTPEGIEFYEPSGKLRCTLPHGKISMHLSETEPVPPPVRHIRPRFAHERF